MSAKSSVSGGTRYHINPETGNPGVCRAKYKCKFQIDDEHHYVSKEDARKAYEKEMQRIIDGSKVFGTGPMDAVPQKKGFLDRSDAFYNRNGKSDEELVRNLATFHYWKSIELQSSGLESAKAKIAKVVALSKVLNHPDAKGWEGWIYDRDIYVNPEFFDHEFSADFKPIPEKKKHEAEKLKDFSEPRFPSNEDDLERSIHDSIEFYNKLNAQEQNVMAFWTGPGSGIYSSVTLKTTNPFGFQDEDPTDLNYFNGNHYTSTIDAALAKAELDTTIVTYRGLNENVLGKDVAMEMYRRDDETGESENEMVATQKFLEKNNYEVGKKIKFVMPQCASKDPSIASRFTEGVVFEVETHRAGSTAVLGAHGAVEEEYVLPRDCEYEVVGIHHNVEYRNDRDDDENKDFYTVVQLRQL